MVFHLKNFEEREISESRMVRYLVSLSDALKHPLLYDDFFLILLYILILCKTFITNNIPLKSNRHIGILLLCMY